MYFSRWNSCIKGSYDILGLQSSLVHSEHGFWSLDVAKEKSREFKALLVFNKYYNEKKKQIKRKREIIFVKIDAKKTEEMPSHKSEN